VAITLALPRVVYFLGIAWATQPRHRTRFHTPEKYTHQRQIKWQLTHQSNNRTASGFRSLSKVFVDGGGHAGTELRSVIVNIPAKATGSCLSHLGMSTKCLLELPNATSQLKNLFFHHHQMRTQCAQEGGSENGDRILSPVNCGSYQGNTSNEILYRAL